MTSTAPRRRALGGLLAASLALTAAGCGGDSSDTASGSSGGTLRVGQLGSSKIYEALFAASGAGEGMPYSVEYSLFPGGGPGFIEAARSGSVDLASMADTPPIFGQVAKAPVKIVAARHTVASDSSVVEILVPKDSPATSLQDLRGKKVAVTEATVLQYTTIRALEQAGMTYKDVQAVNLAPPDAATAFSGGDVDALAALDPQRSLLLAAGAKKVADGTGTTEGLGYVVATDAALADPAKAASVEDYVKRLRRAEAWADAHTPEWAQRYAEVSGLPLPVATSVVEHEQDTWVPIDDAVVKAQQEQADVYTELGLLPTRLDVTQEFDPRFNAAVAGGVQ